jgi:hypothetical protein
MDELKKCPFCGGKAESYYRWNDRKKVWYAFAQCTVCYSIGHTYSSEEEPDEESDIWEKVAEAWNMRAPE